MLVIPRGKPRWTGFKGPSGFIKVMRVEQGAILCGLGMCVGLSFLKVTHTFRSTQTGPVRLIALTHAHRLGRF